MDLVSLNMKATIIRQEKDEFFFTRTELVTVYGYIISGKYANEVNKVREDVYSGRYPFTNSGDTRSLRR
jgi:hypothetical protein